MHDRFYQTLEKTKKIADRRKLIAEVLRTLDTTTLPQGTSLTDRIATPSKDRGISIPFVVGGKYLLYDDNRGADNFDYPYLLAITDNPKEQFIVIGQKDILLSKSIYGKKAWIRLRARYSGRVLWMPPYLQIIKLLSSGSFSGIF